MSVDRLSIAGQRSGGGGREPLKNPFQLASSGGSDVSAETGFGLADLGGDSQEMPSATLEGAAVALSQGRFKTVVKMAETSLKESPACKEVHLWRAVKVYSLMMLSEWSRAEEELLVGKQDMVVVAGEDVGTFWMSLYSVLLPCCSATRPSVEALTEAAEQLRRIPTASSWQEVVVLKSEAVLMVIRLYRSCLLPRDEDHDGLLVELAGLLLRIGALPEAEDVLAEIRSAEAAARVKALIALAEEE
ncbi:hypothetical protein Pmar_PMAR024411 [Perkinsus marinus ATCC 50983]|uniref:Uncharacterized protein n=1 Tax=Perkinsus marinus (strain ATCC 50983 / TXsc) TaxID=423536 RepID=C5KM09_PERM5|nr:hypothetical protein Pmar_PMAR024411 [Perkinsus marinus ATCC 50983]EER14524.1 hypothetical protein Pmar_PMAR024411 [Perkinsus marinus ATCC 50983]|eukprot:XP_002782729.1 hypothetical protein Pmar_PMAR024411 [Perkinsus marinus ATCC 50983]